MEDHIKCEQIGGGSSRILNSCGYQRGMLLHLCTQTLYVSVMHVAAIREVWYSIYTHTIHPAVKIQCF